jgi:hypothetical protein
MTASNEASQLITSHIAELGDWRGKLVARLRKLLNFAKAMQKSFTKVNRMLRCRTKVSPASSAADALLRPAAL